MNLSDWMTDTGTRPEALADAVGVHLVTVYRWKSGAKLPKPPQMARIEAATGGRVGPADFYPKHPVTPIPGSAQTLGSDPHPSSAAPHTTVAGCAP